MLNINFFFLFFSRLQNDLSLLTFTFIDFAKSKSRKKKLIRRLYRIRTRKNKFTIIEFWLSDTEIIEKSISNKRKRWRGISWIKWTQVFFFYLIENYLCVNKKKKIKLTATFANGFFFFVILKNYLIWRFTYN